MPAKPPIDNTPDDQAGAPTPAPNAPAYAARPASDSGKGIFGEDDRDDVDESAAGGGSSHAKKEKRGSKQTVGKTSSLDLFDDDDDDTPVDDSAAGDVEVKTDKNVTDPALVVLDEAASSSPAAEPAADAKPAEEAL